MFKDVFTSIINKSDINLFSTGTVYSLSPLTVKLIPSDDPIQVKSLMSVKNVLVGNRLLLLKFGRQFIAIGVIDDISSYPHYFNFLEWLDYCYYYNQKRVESCQTGWAKNGSYSGTFSNDTTETFLGSQSIRMTIDSATTGWMIAEKNVTVNMKTSENGQAFDNDDYVIFCFKLSNNSAFNTIQLMIIADSGTTSAYYNVTSFTTDSNGWNTLKIKFSDFTGYTTCGWTAVNNVSFRANFKSGYVGAYASCQYIGVVRKHPTISGRHSLFQYKDTTTWNQISGVDEGTNLSVLEFDYAGTPSLQKPKMTFLSKGISYNYCKFSEHYINFSAKAYIHVKNINNVGGLVWRIDSSNYIVAYISGDIMRLDLYVDGVKTPYTSNRAIARNDLITMYLIKQNGYIRLSSSVGIIVVTDVYGLQYGDIYTCHPNTSFDTCLVNLIVDEKSTMYQEEDYYEV